ncbi:hypothetical protein B0A50_08068 [Salinomyces thailandicus]|uniref:Ubiquitin-conjugating enzyme E2C-binding protein n=1 Tax=Salinomyces thailandicus TaxID=706561 RepID=A0A4U0TKU1_9PEZI|nr:hypothetical protein B0A50_08068 [Salinomyces thailandica]
MANSNVSANAATIHLYAEHLQNIRTVSVQACLATHSNNATKATLSADGSTLSLTHEGQSVSIRLPVNVPSGHNDTTLHIPAAPPSSKELTFRLSLEEKPGSNSNLPIRQWKDLPSEGWAEMMDFWHCHKPDVPHNQGHNGSTARGISANSKLAVQQGIGLVGPLHLLLAHEDCQGLSVKSSSSSSLHENLLICAQCETTIGTLDPTTSAYRLRKPSLSISSNANANLAVSNYHNSEKWLACHLLTAAETQGVRKLLVSSPIPNQTPQAQTLASLQIWLFAAELVIASSVAKAPQPVSVVKIFYRLTDTPAESTGKLNTAALSQGEVELLGSDWQLLKNLLESSAALLPSRARVFQDWRVGLLRRFTEEDVTAT